MEIKVCKTHEITDVEWGDIVNGFSNSFNRISSIDIKKKFYTNNVLGFSYHALAYNKFQNVIAHTTVIPYYYNISGKKEKVGLSGGTFVHKDYRQDIYVFKKMYDKLKEKCNEENIITILGVPNKNSFKYSVKILNKKHLGYLDYFILPLKITKFSKRMLPTFFDYFSFLFFSCFSFFLLGVTKIINIKEKKLTFYLIKDKSFLESRFANNYQVFHSKGGINGYFKIEIENELTIAYLMEFNNNGTSDLRSLWIVIWNIIKNFKIDAIVYIGILRIKPSFLFKIPFKLQPKNFPLTSDLLSDAIKNYDVDSFYNIKNWNFNLTNFDVK